METCQATALHRTTARRRPPRRGREEFLLPETECQRRLCKAVVLRADAACAKLELELEASL